MRRLTAPLLPHLSANPTTILAMDTATRPGIKCDLDATCPYRAEKLLITQHNNHLAIDFACVRHAIAHQQAIGEAKERMELRDRQHHRPE